MKHLIGVLIVLLLVATAACSGGGGGKTGGEPPSATGEVTPTSPGGTAPGDVTPVNGTSAGNNGVTIVEGSAKPEGGVPPVPTSGEVPAIPPQEKPAVPPPPDPMVAEITSPAAGSLWPLTMAYEQHISLTGVSNKKEATYQWNILDPADAAVEVKVDATTQLPYFVPKVPGKFMITLSGSAPDGTSNSVSTQITVEKPPDAAMYLKITGMTDGASYPLDATYPLMAMDYSQYKQFNYFSYTWEITGKPQGSKAAFGTTSQSAAFKADVAGTYTITVTAANATGDTAQKGLTVTMLPTRVVDLWGVLLPNEPPKVLLAAGYQEIYFGTNRAIFKYGASKQWLPIFSDDKEGSPALSAARVSAKEVYFGSVGKVMSYDGANFSVIQLPEAYQTNDVKTLSATPGDVWAVSNYKLLHISNNVAEEILIDGKPVSAQQVIAFAPNNVLVLDAAYQPVLQFMGAETGWKKIPPVYTQSDADGVVVMMRCAHGGPTNPVTCLSNKNTLYVSTYDPATGFGPLIKSDTLNPIPQVKVLDMAWSPNGGVMLLDATGQLHSYYALGKVWQVTPGIQTPVINSDYGIIGQAQFNTPFLIAGTGEIFKLDLNDMAWKKEKTPPSFGPRDILQVPNGPIVVVGDSDAGAGILFIDPKTKQETHFIESAIGNSPVYDVVGMSATNLWGSVNSAIVHFDGLAWSKLLPSPDIPMYFNNSGPTPMGTSFDEKEVYVDALGIYKTGDGVTYTPMTVDPPADGGIRTFITLDKDNTLALGFNDKNAFMMWRLDPVTAAWKGVGNAYPGVKISDVDAVSANDITAVGPKGVILHFDGAAWQTEQSGVTDNVSAVSSAGGEVWALTAGGQLLKRDAKTAVWVPVNSLPKDMVCNLTYLHMIDAQDYIYGGPCDFKFVGVMSN